MLDLRFRQESCHLLRPSSEIGPLTRLFLGNCLDVQPLSSTLMSFFLPVFHCGRKGVALYLLFSLTWTLKYNLLLPRGPHPTLITEDITGHHGKGENSVCQEYKNITPHTLPFELSIMKEIQSTKKEDKRRDLDSFTREVFP